MLSYISELLQFAKKRKNCLRIRENWNFIYTELNKNCQQDDCFHSKSFIFDDFRKRVNHGGEGVDDLSATNYYNCEMIKYFIYMFHSQQTVPVEKILGQGGIVGALMVL